MSNLAQQLRDLLSPWSEIPGVAACIVVRDQAPVIAFTGYAALEYRQRIDETTRFNLASVSKQFSGFAARLLEKRGLLQMDDPLLKYLPDLPAAYQAIQIHHLLHHTSGFRDIYNLQAYAGFRRDDVHTRDQLMALTWRLSALNFTPGDRFNYNNTGFILLAEIVHRLTGKTMRQFLEDEIFTPLGMSSTCLSDNHKELIPNFAGHYNRLEDGSYTKAFENVSAGGHSNIITTITDFARWLANYTAPRLEPAVMMSLGETCAFNDGSMNTYAFGLETSERSGKQVWTHGGGAGGFRSEMMFVPEDGIAIGVISNNGSMDAATLGSKVLGLVLPEFAPKNLAATADQSAAFSEKESKEMPGHYQMPDGLLATIQSEEDRLYLQSPFYPTRVPVIKTGDRRYKIELLNADLLPEYDEHGKIVAFVSNSPIGVLRAVKLPPVEVDQQTLLQFTGRYFNEKLLNMWEVGLTNGKLTIFHPHFPQINLFPVLEDEFSSDMENFDRIKFIRSEDNRVVALEFSGDRAFNIHFDKVETINFIS